MSECKECGTELPEHPYLCHACESKALVVRHAAAIAALKHLCAIADMARKIEGQHGERHDPRCKLCAFVRRARAVLAAEEKARA